MNSLQNNSDSAKITASFTLGDREFTDVEVVNAGGWFGKTWLMEIGGSYSSFFVVVEADSITDAIDELIDSKYGHQFIIPESDYGDYDVTSDSPSCSFAGNNSHPVDLEHLMYHGDDRTGFQCLYNVEGWNAPVKPTELRDVQDKMEFYANDDLIDVDIPDEYVTLAEHWYSGQDDLPYALSSTGNLTLGSQRPYSNDVARHLTDKEWHLSLWGSLEIDVMHAADSAEKQGHDDAAALREFETFCEETSAMLRTAYGLEDSEAV